MEMENHCEMILKILFMDGLVEVTMKKSKEILKQAGGGIFLYILPCLAGAYESYYRGANLNFTARVGGCVIFFIIIGAIVSFIKKEYDYRKYNGYIFLFISLGLMLQIMVQGDISSEKRVTICVVGYVLSILLGILVGLLATRKIVVKNTFIKSMLKIVGTVIAFVLTFLCVVGKRFFGRRGAILIEMTGGQEKSARGMWYCILVLTLVFSFISALAIVDVTAVPDYYKKNDESKNEKE